MATSTDLLSFVEASPSPFHCAVEAARRLEEKGFTPHDEAAAPAPVAPGELGYTMRAGTLIAWKIGSQSPASAGFRLLAAHTDSPNLRIKPNGEYRKEGYVQWGVEVYGGVLTPTWMDRDLGVCGRIAVRTDAGIEMRLVRIDQAIARVANLAIHLNRTVNTEGLKLNKQRHLPPIICLDSGLDAPNALNQLLAKNAGCDPDSIMDYDLSLFDLQAPALGGLHKEFIFAPRMDNQASCYTALEALIAHDQDHPATAVAVLFDHEECGSTSDRGASSGFLKNVLTRIERDHQERDTGGMERATANSFLVSADMAHAVHPNYADKHEMNHKPRINGGPVIKTNVNMRYATDALVAARFRSACESQGIPIQNFVNRTDLACGSTIGPISAAQLAIPTIDVGSAMLSMHSIREQAGSQDIEWMAQALREVLLQDG